MITNNNDVTGIKMANSEYIISQFANDQTLNFLKKYLKSKLIKE